jgi:opacity protein-like surface antigen
MLNVQTTTFNRYVFGRRKMMKKLLIMLAVLAMATVANAALVLDPVEASRATGLNVQTDPIDEEDAQQAAFIAVGGGGGALDAGTMQYAGTLSVIDDFTGVDPDLTALVDAAIDEASTLIHMISLFDGNVPAAPVMGVMVSYGVTEGTDQTMVYLLNPDTLEIMSTAKIIPEPVTIALLGLGGLFLRRRK